MTFILDHEKSLQYKTVAIAVEQPVERTLSLRLQEEEASWKKKDERAIYRIRPGSSFQLLQLLTATKRFFYKGQPLICDFFSRLKIEYLVEQKGDKVFLTILIKDKPFTLSECDLILQGSPHACVKGQFLRFFDPSVTWQMLKSTELTLDEYKKFKKELLEEENPPDLIELESTPDPIIKPTVQLTDQTLCFLNPVTAHEKELVEAGYIKKQVGSSSYYCPADKAIKAIRSLFQKGFIVLDVSGNEVVPVSAQNYHTESLEQDAQVRGSVRFANDEVDIVRIAESTKEKKKLIPLSSGKVGLLDFDSSLSIILSETTLIGNRLILKRKSFNTLVDLIDLPETTFLKEAARPDELSNHALSDRFKGTLRPYQQVGVNWMQHLYSHGRNGLLADEMGLGKTVQILAFLASKPFTTLIVMPTSLLGNWKREIHTFLPSHKVCLYHGPDRSLDDADIVLTSYGVMRLDVNKLTKVHFDCVVIDEAQAIKNRETQNAKALAQLDCGFRLSLTGTPIENSLSELVSQFHFLEPGLFDEDEPLDATIKKKISPLLLRRKKRDVAPDLPEKIEQTVYVSMHDEQRAFYDSFVATLKKGLLQKIALGDGSKQRMEILEAILRLRQICCHPVLVEQLASGFELRSAKFDLVLDDIETLVQEGKKVVLFSQFAQMLALLTKGAKARGITPLLLDGSTVDRLSLVDRFQNDPDCPLFFISLKAGGVGLNLTKADYVLLYDPWWNSAQEAQAIDRAHRIGRTGTVFIKRYILENSIEEKILALQEQKEALSESILADDLINYI
jgi:SNF2 family DNA or RNA helicase